MKILTKLNIIIIFLIIIFSWGCDHNKIDLIKEIENTTKTNNIINDQPPKDSSWIAHYDIITIGTHQYILFKEKNGSSIFVLHNRACPNSIHKLNSNNY